MRTATKIILIIVVFLIGGLVITLIGQSTGRSKGGGPIGIVVMFGIFAACAAIWKYKPESEQKKDISADNQSLDKRNSS